MLFSFNPKFIINLFLLGFLTIIVFGLNFALALDRCNTDSDCGASSPQCACDPNHTDIIKEGWCIERDATAFCPPTKYTKIEELIESVSNWIFYIGLILAPLMFVIAGAYFITAAGDQNKVKTGKSILTWTIVGLVVILMVKVFVDVIEFVLGTT